MSTDGELVDMPNGRRARDHATGGGGHVRVDQQAVYELISPPGADDPVVIDLERGVLWVSVPATGHPVTVRRSGFELVATAGSTLIEASLSGDTLVLVAEGTLSLLDRGGAARFLHHGEGAVLAVDGTIAIDHVADDELVGDPWVSANLRLDDDAERTAAAQRPPSRSDLEAVMAFDLADLQEPPDDDDSDASTRRESDEEREPEEPAPPRRYAVRPAPPETGQWPLLGAPPPAGPVPPLGRRTIALAVVGLLIVILVMVLLFRFSR